jgi:DNA-directed RNA polymerase subunit beta
VYFDVVEDTATGRPMSTAKLIPSRGAWLEFETSTRDVLSVKVDRKRKIPVTTLIRALASVEGAPIKTGDNDEMLALYEDVDPNHRFLQATMDKDPATNKGEALLEFYRRLRPGDPPNMDNARQLLNSLFFSFRRYDLGRVGRHKLSKRLRTDIPQTERILTPVDLIEIVREMIRINNGRISSASACSAWSASSRSA